jgi:hypothetical protein
MTVARILTAIRAAIRTAFGFKPADPEPTQQTVNPNTKRTHRRRVALDRLGLPADYRGSLKEAEARACKGETGETFHPVSPPHTPLKNLNKKKYETVRISEDWQPDAKRRRLAEKLFGAEADTKIEIYRAYWLAQSELDPRARKSESEWQAHFEFWIRTEADKQITLPFGRDATVIQGGKTDRRRNSDAKRQRRNSGPIAARTR